MKSEIKCDDDQNSLSKEERKQKKEERRKKKKERLKDKQNRSDVEQPCEDAAKNTSLDVVTESSKKKHKRKKRNSDFVDDDIGCEGNTGEHINGSGKIKRQKTEDIEQITNTNCDSSLVEINSKKTKRKKEKTISIDSSYDTNQLPEVSQDITRPAKKKNKKHKKSRAESADDENVMPAKIDSTLLQMDSDIIHKKESKKQNQRMQHSTNEEIEDTEHTDSKENHSSPTKSEHSKKKKKHSKHNDCEPTDETDSNISRKKHKKKSKSASCISGNDEVQGNTDEHSMKSQDIMKHVTSDLNISNTRDEQRSKHKKQKNHSKNSPPASMVKNSSGKEQLCNETSECSNPTSDKIIKSEQSPACATATLGNWQGNLFESSERQNKFLRLLGGMKKSNSDAAEKSKDSATLAGTKKKGLFGSLASLSSTASSGSSAALDVNAAASLNQKLEDEYNKAMNFKLSGKVGTGFGFVPDPAQGKKFHIDVNKSKSVKFDD